MQSNNKNGTRNFETIRTSGIGVSYNPLFEELTVCADQILNGSQNTIRVYNNGVEPLIINLTFSKIGVIFRPSKNNFTIENGTNDLVTFFFEIESLAATGIGTINIIGYSTIQEGNPAVESVRVDINFLVENTRRIFFTIKSQINNRIIPNVMVSISRLMVENIFLMYSSIYSTPGNGLFFIPDGTYKLQVYKDNSLIGEKMVNVSSNDVNVVIYCNYSEISISELIVNVSFFCIIVIIGSLFGTIIIKDGKKIIETIQKLTIVKKNKYLLKLIKSFINRITRQN
ncbi:MAG: hypothetical protein MUP85_25375 [Candidatus Lokiarchaeota archaeon]|nr:hypothetical protein [Candidatus Lokiarchaeota archaeon]